MFKNKNCIDRNILKKLKVDEVSPDSNSVYKSYLVSYGDDILNKIDIPKDKFIKDILLSYTNASINENGTINVGDGLSKDLIAFSICTEDGYELRLIQLPQGNVTSEDLDNKLSKKADLTDGKVPNSLLNLDTQLKTSSNNPVTNSAITTYLTKMNDNVMTLLADKADLVNGKIPSNLLTIDSKLSSTSTNPIANSVVTNNFVKFIHVDFLSDANVENVIRTLKEYESNLDESISHYTVIAVFNFAESNNGESYLLKDYTFCATIERENEYSISFVSIEKYSHNQYNIQYKIDLSATSVSVYEYKSDSKNSIKVDTFKSTWIRDTLYETINDTVDRSDIIIYTNAIEISNVYTILPKNVNDFFIGIFNPNVNRITFMEVGNSCMMFTISFNNTFKLSVVNTLDLDLLHNVIIYDLDPLSDETTLDGVIEKMGDSSAYEFNTIRPIKNGDTYEVHTIHCKITNVEDKYILEGYDPLTGINYKNVTNDAKTLISDLLVEDVSNLTSYTISTKLRSGTNFASAFTSNEFTEKISKIINDDYNTNFNLSKDLTIILKINNYPLYFKGILWYYSDNEYTGYKYFGREYNSNAITEQLDFGTLKFNVTLEGEVKDVVYKDSTTISDSIINIKQLETKVTNLQNTHSTDISDLTTKLTKKLSVVDCSGFDETTKYKKALIQQAVENTDFNEDGLGTCSIVGLSGTFCGTYLKNVSLVGKVVHNTTDKYDEISGTVSGEYTITGPSGTDPIKYIKHYDLHLRWNTETDKEIEYSCEELNVETSLLDTLSYGIRWNSDKSSSPLCQRIGNLQMHRELPIQNGMKGCIVKFSTDKKPEIQYYLKEDNWNYKSTGSDRIATTNNDLLCENHESEETYKIGLTNGIKSYKKYVELGKPLFYITVRGSENFITESNLNNRCYLTPNKGDDNFGILRKIETDSNDSSLVKLYFELDSTHRFDTSVCNYIGIASRLDGYDGEVMVEVPEFYIRSWKKTNGDMEVRISQYKIDDTWEHQPRLLVAAYHDTILNSIPDNMGYLSTLESNSAISIMNTNSYCRGGVNLPAYDDYITTDKFRSMLGKPVTNIKREIMRDCVRKTGKEILSYLQYKRILCWLYFIEYANFNCQAAFNSALTSEGYKQGGLGNGVTTVNNVYWDYYNGCNPLTPNGYTNEFGNGTNIKTMTIVVPTTSGGDPASSITQYVPRWHGIENPFGDITTNVDGVIINSASIGEGGNTYSEVYATDDTTLYNDGDYKSMKRVGIERSSIFFIKEWDLGNTAEIVPILFGFSTTQYKCDYHGSNLDTGLRILLLNGNASCYSNAGLGYFNSSCDVDYAYASVGFRTSCVIE